MVPVNEEMDVKAYEYPMFENGASPRIMKNKANSPNTGQSSHRPGKLNLSGLTGGDMPIPTTKMFPRTPAGISPTNVGRLKDIQNNMLFPPQQSGEAHLITEDSDQPH